MARAPPLARDPVETPEGESPTGTKAGPTIILVDGNEKRGKRVQDRLASEVTFEVFTTPDSAVDAIDRWLAVLVVSATFPDDDVEMLVYTARGRSPFCHVALLSKEAARLDELEVPRDEELTSPLTWGEFGETITSMLLRAQYLAGLQHYYKQSLALNTRRIRLKGEDVETDPEFTALEEELARLEGRLDGLSEQFSPEEYRAVMGRIQEENHHTPGEGKPVANPATFGLPDSCPRCGLEFGIWHGPMLGHGFERIAANVWRCTECNQVMDNPDPSNRRIARR